MFSSTLSPAVDEGGGRVGLAYRAETDVVVTGEPVGYYRLHDCRSGARTGFDLLIPGDDATRPPPTLEAFLSAAREQGLMATPRRLTSAALAAGLPASPPDASRWNSAAIDSYAACACAHFYPETVAAR